MFIQIRLALLCFSWVVLTCMTGCWSGRELNDLSVVLGMGIELVEDEYYVTLQFVDPSQMSRNRKSERSVVQTISVQEKTIFEAIRKMTTKTSRNMYASHLRLLILDEKMAKQGIKEALDLLFRSYEPRPDFYIVLAKDYSPREILSMVTPTEMLPAIEMYRSLQLSEKVWAPTSAMNVVKLYKALAEEGIEPVLTGLTLRGDVQKGASSENVKQPTSFLEYMYEGIGVFREDRFIGWMDITDSKAYSFITNQVKNTVGSVKCPSGSGEFVVEVTKSKSKIQPLMKYGKPAVRINMLVEGNIGEANCHMDLKKEEDFLKLQQAGKEKLEYIIEHGIEHVQKQFGVDVFGFGIEFHRKLPRQWHQWKADWNDTFKQMPVELELNYKLRETGKIISPLEGSTK